MSRPAAVSDDDRAKKKLKLTFQGVSIENAFKHCSKGQELTKFNRTQKSGLKNLGNLVKQKNARQFFLDCEQGTLKWISENKQWKYIFFEEVKNIYVLMGEVLEPHNNGGSRRYVADSNGHRFAIITRTQTLWLQTKTRDDMKLWVTAIEAGKWLEGKQQLTGTGIQGQFYRHVERQFIQHSTNGKFINSNDLVNVIRELNMNMSKKEVKELLSEYDYDSDSGLDLLEFLRLLRYIHTLETLQPLFLQYITPTSEVMEALGPALASQENEDKNSPKELSPNVSSDRSKAPLSPSSQKFRSQHLESAFLQFFHHSNGGKSTTEDNTSKTNVKEKLADEYGGKDNSGNKRLPPPTCLEKQLGFITDEDFAIFLGFIQGLRGPKKMTTRIFGELSSPACLSHKFLTEFGFSRYLCSSANSIIDPNFTLLQKSNMNKPICDYWINSSHNTYLEKGQLVGESSVAQYFHVLMRGCRCVELDCWDGDKNDPIITHGFTLTKKIRLRDVVHAISKHGFTASPYPLILSIEQHCTTLQLIECRKIFEQELSTVLLRAQTKDAPLVTPTLGKNKVIIKAKKWSLSEEDLEKEAQKLPNGKTQLLQEMEKYNDVIYMPSKHWGPQEFKGADDPKKLKKEKERKVKEENSGGATASLSVPTAADAYTVSSTDSTVMDPFFEEDEKDKMAKELLERDVKSIVSFVETKLEKYAKKYPFEIYNFNAKFLSRIYPSGTRINSSNADPITPWGYGSQCVALNFQTFDDATVLNEGRFRDINGGCGYVLKPQTLIELGSSRFVSIESRQLEITIISGHCFPKSINSQNGKPDEYITDPYIVISSHHPGEGEHIYRTERVNNNGFDPKWNEKFVLPPHKYPDLGMIKFEVWDDRMNEGVGGVGGGPNPKCLCAAAVPVNTIRQGFRWVHLFDHQFNDCDNNTGLLVHVNTYDSIREVTVEDFTVTSTELPELFNGEYTWNRMWCEGKPVYEKDYDAKKDPDDKKSAMYIYYNGNKSRSGYNGWAIGPEPWKEDTLYALNGDIDAYMPNELTKTWHLCRREYERLPPTYSTAVEPKHGIDGELHQARKYIYITCLPSKKIELAEDASIGSVEDEKKETNPELISLLLRGVVKMKHTDNKTVYCRDLAKRLDDLLTNYKGGSHFRKKNLDAIYDPMRTSVNDEDKKARFKEQMMMESPRMMMMEPGLPLSQTFAVEEPEPVTVIEEPKELGFLEILLAPFFNSCSPSSEPVLSEHDRSIEDPVEEDPQVVIQEEREKQKQEEDFWSVLPPFLPALFPCSASKSPNPIEVIEDVDPANAHYGIYNKVTVTPAEENPLNTV